MVSCNKVPRFVRGIMLAEQVKGKLNKMDIKEHRLFVQKAVMEQTYGEARKANIPTDEEGQHRWALRESLRDIGGSAVSYSPSCGASGSNSNTSPATRVSCSGTQTTIGRYYSSPSSAQVPFDLDLARSKAPSQPRVDIMLQGDAKVRLGKAWSKWFHANDIPGRKADCPYFVSAIKLTQQLGEGVNVPSGRELDGPLLDRNYEDLLAQMNENKGNWARYGVTIMSDSWTGPYKMCIINFMIFCNGRMFFHSSVDATGQSHNAEYLYKHIDHVVQEVGEKNVIQIVTDNGSNYKAACKQLVAEYPHITWQPCAAHTINLMLKEIASFNEVAEVVHSAQRMCKFFYNHNRLHAMMREKIGGELVRWNATRFGTVFLFLQSFWDRKDKFQAWMVSDEWNKSDWKDELDRDFTYDCLTSRKWWENVELVLKAVTPLYYVLRFADQQKNGTISGFIPRMVDAHKEIFAKLKHDKLVPKDHLHRINEVITRRTRYLFNGTLMPAAAGLDPQRLYKSNYAQEPAIVLAVSLALKKIAGSPEEASIAIDEYTNIFSQKRLLFGSLEARSSALRANTTPADWWWSYGGQCKTLQKLAVRIVAQCNSSSGCERNWSTFALVHTKLRNKLGYDKLKKLVYVNYNLKLQLQQLDDTFQRLRQKGDRSM